MWLTRVFLVRPTLGFVLIVLTALAGILALQNLVVQEEPNSGLPTISITAPYSGASTTDLQTEIAEPIENQLAGQPYLQNIQTTIESGSVSIAATFSLASTTTEDIANVEEALQAAQHDLPSTVQPTIRVADPSQPTVVTLALVSKKYDPASLGAIANNQIVPVMEQLPGVSSVNVGGTTTPAFMVTVNPNLLAASNLTITDVVNAITPNNVRPPGGYVYQPGRETTLDVRGDLPDPQSVANLPISVTASVPSAGSSSSGSGGSSAGGGAGTSSFGSASTAGGSAVATTGTEPAASGGAVPEANVTTPPLNLAGYAAPTSAPTAAAASPAPAPSGATFGTSAGSSSSSAMTSAGTTSGGAASSGVTTSGGTSTTGTSAAGATSTGATSTGGTRTSTSTAPSMSSSTTGFAQPSTSIASTSTTSSTSASSLTNESAQVNVPIDTPVTPATTSSTSASSSGTASDTAEPSVSSSAFGSGAGTSTSAFIGQLGNWAVPSANKRISDVGVVTDATVVPRIQALLNDQPGVVLLVTKQATASEVTVSNEIVKQLPSLERQFPGITFQVAHVQSTFTEEQVESVEHTLVEGVILTAVVMLFFLGSWRNAVVVMVAIPTSLGVTLFVMWCLGLTLDTISLMAMTLVIGILIDDSTVVLENVERHHAEGEEPADAALNGRSEIGLAAIVLTLVDVIVFLPIAFAGGEVGQSLHEFAIVITVATLTSLFVSFTITPMLAGLWSLKSTWRPWPVIRWFDGRFTALRDRYAQQWLPAVMNRPWPVLIAAVVLIALAYLLVPTGLVGEEYIPAEDQGIIYAQVAFPAGHPLSETEAAMKRLSQATTQLIPAHDLGYAVSLAGAYSAPFGGFVQEGNAGQLSIYLNADRKTSTTQYLGILQKRFAQLEPNAGFAIAAATQQGGGNQETIDEMVETTDQSDPTPYAAKVFAALRATPGSSGVQNSASNSAPQMEVQFDRPMLQALDVASGTASAAVEAAFGGDIATQIETPLKGLTDIEVIYPESAQTSLANVLQIPVRAANGNIVHLGDVASLHYEPAPLVVNRVNRTRIVYITGNVAPGYELSNVINAFQQRLGGMHLPKTVILRPAALGQQDLLNQALVSLLTSLALSILLVFLVIVALYNSYRTPFVTLFAVPLATIGALGALWITHSTLNLYSLIGIVLLVGLVTKNGILLVDYADTVRERGASREEGMRQAAATRFRPIIMTTVAMIAGMFPLALGLEPGAQSRASLAIVVIGGLLSSLLLTLFIVPIMYHWLAPKELSKPVTFGLPRAAPGRQPA